MTSVKKKKKRLNTPFYLDGEKSSSNKMKGYQMYHKKDRVAGKRMIKEYELQENN